MLVSAARSSAATRCATFGTKSILRLRSTAITTVIRSSGTPTETPHAAKAAARAAIPEKSSIESRRALVRRCDNRRRRRATQATRTPAGRDSHGCSKRMNGIAAQLAHSRATKIAGTRPRTAVRNATGRVASPRRRTAQISEAPIPSRAAAAAALVQTFTERSPSRAGAPAHGAGRRRRGSWLEDGA